MRTCLITAFITCVKLTAWRSALLVNRAAHGLPDFAGKSHAAAMGLVRATHGNVVVINRLGHFFRNRTVRMRGGLPPVERHAKVGATRAAVQTGITHFLTRHINFIGFFRAKLYNTQVTIQNSRLAGFRNVFSPFAPK